MGNLSSGPSPRSNPRAAESMNGSACAAWTQREGGGRRQVGPVSELRWRGGPCTPATCASTSMTRSGADARRTRRSRLVGRQGRAAHFALGPVLRQRTRDAMRQDQPSRPGARCHTSPLIPGGWRECSQCDDECFPLPPRDRGTVALRTPSSARLGGEGSSWRRHSARSLQRRCAVCDYHPWLHSGEQFGEKMAALRKHNVEGVDAIPPGGRVTVTAQFP